MTVTFIVSLTFQPLSPSPSSCGPTGFPVKFMFCINSLVKKVIINIQNIIMVKTNKCLILWFQIYLFLQATDVGSVLLVAPLTPPPLLLQNGVKVTKPISYSTLLLYCRHDFHTVLRPGFDFPMMFNLAAFDFQSHTFSLVI